MSDTYELSVDARKLDKSAINAIRVTLGLIGVVAIVLGALLLFWPEKSAIVAAVLFGIYFLIVGIVRLASGIFTSRVHGGYRVLNVLLGLLVIVAAVFILREPSLGVAVLGLLVGIAWIIDGVAALVTAGQDGARWFGILFGILSIVAGIIVLFVPEGAIAVLLVIGGIFLLIGGIVALVQAFSFGRAALKQL